MAESASPVTGHSPWSTFVACAIATFISTLDMSIVNVAFYEISVDFAGTPRSTIAWVVTAYSILFGSLLVVSGRLADQVGRKRFFLAGAALFLLGSLLCAVAPTMGALIGGRAVQGIGGAMLLPASTGLLLSAFPAEKRGQVMAWSGSVGALGVASGPTVGAFFVATYGWRSAFWINVPVCLLAIVLAARNTTESPRVPGRLPDVVSAFVFTFAVGSLVWGISRSETQGWGDSSVLGLFGVAAVLAVVVVRRSRTLDDALLPARLFAERTFTLANIATMLYASAFSANILNNVLFQRTVWHFSATKAGWFSVLSPVTVSVTSAIIGRKMAAIGYRRLLITGPLLVSSTIIGSIVLLDTEPTPWFPFLPFMFVLGLGLGSTFPALSACTILRLPQSQFALGGAINNTFRQVGASVGVALVVTVQARGGELQGFHNGWRVALVFSIAAALVSVFQPGRDRQPVIS